MTDIRKAYPSIKLNQLEDVLISIGFYSDVVQTIIELNTYKNHLPIGFAASPLLFNLVLNVIDNRIARFIRDKKIIMTRYFDDYVFSSQSEIPLKIRNEVILALKSHGLRPHPQKTIYQNVKEKAIQVTGLTITDHGIILSKERRRNFEGILWLAIREPMKWKPVVDGKLGLFKMVYGNNLPKRISYLIQEFDLSYAQAWRKSKGLPPI